MHSKCIAGYMRAKYRLYASEAWMQGKQEGHTRPAHTGFVCGYALNTNDVTTPKFEPAPATTTLHISLHHIRFSLRGRTTDRPKETGVFVLTRSQDASVGCNDLCLDEIVDR